MAKIDDNEIRISEKCIAMALEKGASKARVKLEKSTMDLVAILNGEVDKVTHCFDESLSVTLFVDGRYGTYSTNRMNERELGAFLDRAIDMTRMLEKDECRDLPAPERICKDAVQGDEMGLNDLFCEVLTPQHRLSLALKASIFEATQRRSDLPCRLISEESEYSDSTSDLLLLDSQGLRCRHTETSFDYWVEMTVVTPDGDKFSGSWWHSSPRLDGLEIQQCGPKALDLAVAQIGPKSLRSGRYNIVIDSEVAPKIVSPILKALNAYSIQQDNSFLKDSLGKRIFPEGLTITDRCHTRGESGSTLFDSEGVATVEAPVIEDGTVMEYFVNTYMANKMGIAPTAESAVRPEVRPFPKEGLTRDDLMELCGNGVLITDFNGGNSNQATGDFSYGVEGFAFRNGKITHPVREMVLTGNFITLWSRFIAAGSDSRRCKEKLVPSLAFAEADLSA